MTTKKKPTRPTVKKRIPAKHKAKALVKRARPLHHKVFLHPFTIFVLLCTGVFIANWTFRANADSFTVKAKVAAASLTQAATITQPLDGAIVTSIPINVFGTCPSQSYVVLTRNSTMSGVSVCSAGNTYSIQTSLYPNDNVLNVQAYNYTDDPGPTTPEITIKYIQPVVPPPATLAPTTTPTATPTYSNKPHEVPAVVSLPILTSNFSYNSFAVNATFEWPIEIAGGVAPYKITVDWGDGNTTTSDAAKPVSTWIKHKYIKAGIYKIIVKVTDANGNESVLQLVAIIKAINTTASSNLLTTNGESTRSGSFLSGHILELAWGSYTVVMLMTISFWLGERQKIADLINKSVGRNRQHKV